MISRPQNQSKSHQSCGKLGEIPILGEIPTFYGQLPIPTITNLLKCSPR